MLRFKDCCKRDMTSFGIDPDTWETVAHDRSKWRSVLKQGVKKHDEVWLNNIKRKRLRTKEVPCAISQFTCDLCGRKCGAAIGLYSHRRRCGVPSAT